MKEFLEASFPDIEIALAHGKVFALLSIMRPLN